VNVCFHLKRSFNQADFEVRDRLLSANKRTIFPLGENRAALIPNSNFLDAFNFATAIETEEHRL